MSLSQFWMSGHIPVPKKTGVRNQNGFIIGCGFFPLGPQFGWEAYSFQKNSIDKKGVNIILNLTYNYLYIYIFTGI